MTQYGTQGDPVVVHREKPATPPVAPPVVSERIGAPIPIPTSDGEHVHDPVEGTVKPVPHDTSDAAAADITEEQAGVTALSEAQRALMALRLQVPAEVADDVAEKVNAAIAEARGSVVPESTRLAAVEALVPLWENAGASLLIKGKYDEGRRDVTFQCVDDLRRVLGIPAR